MLQWLGYEGKEDIEIKSLDQWGNFTRKVCYFNHQGSDDLFKVIFLSNEAITHYVSRGAYVMQMALESCLPFSYLY